MNQTEIISNFYVVKCIFKILLCLKNRASQGQDQIWVYRTLYVDIFFTIMYISCGKKKSIKSSVEPIWVLENRKESRKHKSST